MARVCARCHVMPCHFYVQPCSCCTMPCCAQPSQAMPCHALVLLPTATSCRCWPRRRAQCAHPAQGDLMGIPGRAWDRHACLNTALPCRAYIATPCHAMRTACHVCRKQPSSLPHAPSQSTLQTLAETAKAAGKSEADTAALLAACREKLFNVRAQRPRPHRDEKVDSAAPAVCLWGANSMRFFVSWPSCCPVVLTPSLAPACAPHRLCRHGRACPFRPLPPPPACCRMSSRPLAGSSQWRDATQWSIWRQRSRCGGCVAWLYGTCLLLWFGFASD